MEYISNASVAPENVKLNSAAMHRINIIKLTFYTLNE